MGCKFTKVTPARESLLRYNDHDKNNDNDNIKEDPIPSQRHTTADDTFLVKPDGANDHTEILIADPQAFNQSLIQQRQQAIDNRSYRSTIESWNPNSLQQLVEIIKAFSKGKNLVDRHWIIFYWITSNIEYDTVSYFSKNYADQSAEGVFRTKKGVCAGYANIYKYLCDHIELPCKVVSGFAKGYGFDDGEGAPSETNHAWNVVEIDHHWYLMESTWGAGHLNKQKIFERKLNSYYFLPRPNEMIYHHLPKDEKWQLLRSPIKMEQYMQLPNVYPSYFELNIELVSPLNQAQVALLPDKPYALVLLRALSDVHIIANLELHDQEIDGGHRIIFDNQKQLYYCYFAPSNVGKHKITVYGKRGITEDEHYDGVLNLTLNITKMPINPISFPETWKNFFDLGLEVITPQNTHLIKLNNGATHTEIQIKTSENVELLGRLKNENGEEVMGGHQIYYDRQKNIWKCNFAPNRDGLFEALIMAKKTSDVGSYSSAISFKIDAKQIPSPPLSYPKTWQLFYDLDMKIITPRDQATIILSENQSEIEVHLQTPEDVHLLGRLTNDKDEKIKDGHQIFYDRQAGFWRCKFSPNKVGIFNALIMAKKKTDPGKYSSAVSFKIEAKQIPSPPLSYPETWPVFYDLDLKIVTPRDQGTISLPKNQSEIEVHLQTPEDVHLLGRLSNDKDEKIKDGHQVFYDRQAGFWRCRFAPNEVGMFNALIMAKKKTDPGSYSSAVSFKIEAKQIPSPPLSYPETWPVFYDLDLKIVTPRDQGTISLPKNQSEIEVHLQTPEDVHLLGRLSNDKDEKIKDGHQVFYDRQAGFWRCRFAPNEVGMFNALIMAKKKTDPGSYSSAISFIIEANQIPSPPISYPNTWQIFYDLDLKIEAPRNRSHAIWPDGASYAEVLIQAPDDAQLSCGIKYENVEVENGSIAQFDNNKKLWQLLFAPQRTGTHELFVYAKRNADTESTSTAAIKFHLDVTKLRRPMKFPLIYTKFQTNKCQIYTPIDGILKKGSVVPIHCVIPGATDVNLMVDSKWLNSEGYKDPILQRQVTVGSKEVTIYAKYGEKSSYDGLVKYTVQ